MQKYQYVPAIGDVNLDRTQARFNVLIKCIKANLGLVGCFYVLVSYADVFPILFYFMQDSMVMPVTKVLVAVTLLTLLVAIFFKETPKWLKSSNLSSLNFPPWVLACIVIAFSRLRKRTKDVLQKLLR
jgi:hypothetical protein